MRKHTCSWGWVGGALLLAAGGTLARPTIPPLAEVPDFAVRVRVLRVGEDAPAADAAFSLAVGDGTAVTFTGDVWSSWAESTRTGISKALAAYPNSYNRRWQVRTGCTITWPDNQVPAVSLHLDVETRLLPEGAINRTPAELSGRNLGLLLWRDDDNTIQLDTLAGHGRRVHDRAMRAAAIPPEDRPKRIIFGDRYIGGDSDAIAWREGIERLCGLGFNAMHGVPPAYIPVVREGGISRLWGAVYSPPGYAFSFATNRQEIFRAFAEKQISSALDAGWRREEIAFWVVSDEPGWYYPAQYETFNKDPLAMADFHSYLQKQGLRPRSLGVSRWQDIRLTGRHTAVDLPSRRLFYWSNRFAPWASSRFFAEVTHAFEEILGDGFPIMINFNNFIGRLYQPGPVANNSHKDDPDAAMGQHDWLEFGRQRGSTCISTEDWFGDASAPQWSFYATRLRSAAELADTGFGSLVIPRTSGQRPEGMAQKLLALVGQGAKNIKFFTFGPEYNFPGNCYSYHTSVYKPLSLGMQITGRAEELLYPGRLRRPQTAILMPQSAQLWDLAEMEKARGVMDVTNTDMFRSHMAHMAETYGLHLALQHAAVPVQTIDEEACLEPQLADYRIIYLTAPDLPVEAARGLLRWVRRGGTLVMTAGSGLHDRYHQPMDLLSDAAGARPAKAIRPVLVNLASVAEGDQVTLPGKDTPALPSYGERETIKVRRRTTVVARFADDTPALTTRTLGRGRILRFALFPGLCYRRSARVAVNGLPGGFDDRWRELITAPVREAQIHLPVAVDRPLIDAPALFSEGGVAVTLLNWSGEAQESVHVTIRTPRPPSRVVSARRGPLPFVTREAAAGDFTFATDVTLDLADVDVLSLYTQK